MARVILPTLGTRGDDLSIPGQMCEEEKATGLYVPANVVGAGDRFLCSPTESPSRPAQ